MDRHNTQPYPAFFDVHSHLNDGSFDDDRTEVVERMREKNVWTITVGTDRALSQKALDLANEHFGMFATVGLHPTDTYEDLDVSWYRERARGAKVVAIGECGLDYFRMKGELADERKRQMEIFEAQIELAVELDLPLMIHCRDAHDDAIDLLNSKKREHGNVLRGNIHFFTGTYEHAKQYFDIDFTVSFPGVITFAREYDETVRNAPLQMVLSETDSPYAAPVPHRGKRNEPVFVEEVVNAIASVRKEDHEKVRATLVENAFRVFGLPKS